MIKHPIRTFLGLTVLYIVIILGIFLLQFRSETAFSVNIGQMRLQIAETVQADGSKELKNRFLIAFRGLILSGDETNPVKIEYADGTRADAVLSSWEQPTPLSCTLRFGKDISITFTVSEATASPSLSIAAQLPAAVQAASLPYKPAGGYIVTEQTAARSIISSKSAQYEIAAFSVTDSYLTLSRRHAAALYEAYDPTSLFDFASVTGMPLASESAYNTTVRQFKTDFTQLFAKSISDSLTEQSTVSYVAAMAENGNYRTAINRIPDSVKNSAKRTYLSAPYFNSLVSMNRSLVMQIENVNSMIDYALQSKSLDIFTLYKLDSILRIQNDREKARILLSLPGTFTEFSPTVAQAAGILLTYAGLSKTDPELAAPLGAVTDACLDVLAAACSLNGTTLQLTENGTQVPLLQIASAGTALIAYGKLTGTEAYTNSGYMIINSYINSTAGFDLRTMSELYPILEPNNSAYPHVEVIANAQSSGTGKTVWAWTAAQAIGYERDSAGNLLLTVDFPQEETHYLIINGIEPFRRIDIYGVAFRTDPRFETYNSSGYVYNRDTGTLFLKSRHKTQKETVKLYYDTPAPVDSESDRTEPAAETAAE